MRSVPNTAILFPGQGSQTSDMRDAVEAHDPELLARCADLVGEDPFARIEESTAFQQPGIFCASIVNWRQMEPHVTPQAMAGHSMGEITALAAAGALTVDAALELVVTRGRLMAEGAAEHSDGAMLALLKGTPEQAEELAESHGVFIANDNAPGQVVLSGSRDALERVVEAARSAGQRAMFLAVAGAFHSPAMEGAAKRFREALDKVTLAEPNVPVISCATAAPFEDVRRQLGEALVRPVCWRQTMAALDARGVTDFVDAGPGQVLAGLAKRILPDAKVRKAEELDGAAA